MDSHPQEAVEVDWAHPATDSLIAAIIPGVGSLLSGLDIVGNVTVANTPHGPMWAGWDGASFLEATGSPPIRTGDSWTALVFGIRGAGTSEYRWISEGGNLNAGKGWTIHNRVPDGFRLGYGGVTIVPGASETVPSFTPTMLGMRVVGNAGTFLKDGRVLNTRTYGTMLEPASRDLRIGASHNGTANSFVINDPDTRVGVVLLWRRALSDEEVAAISQNPWQLFRGADQFIPGTTPATAPSAPAQIASAVAVAVAAVVSGIARTAGAVTRAVDAVALSVTTFLAARTAGALSRVITPSVVEVTSQPAVGLGTGIVGLPAPVALTTVAANATPAAGALTRAVDVVAVVAAAQTLSRTAGGLTRALGVVVVPVTVTQPSGIVGEALGAPAAVAIAVASGDVSRSAGGISRNALAVAVNVTSPMTVLLAGLATRPVSAVAVSILAPVVTLSVSIVGGVVIGPLRWRVRVAGDAAHAPRVEGGAAHAPRVEGGAAHDPRIIGPLTHRSHDNG